ncbi:UDP-glucose 4-epimerase [BD1-7 clade bacterium]|uniref:UDP-glucose 4-epimerase n=1 Tax=BD1-7 clade bacterium TaxID=2029982 RepID=A0A5S9P3E5_9GAMM|nr:UDP-glucose 4-epimerase [BD1-7 clade bacterium]CAA0122955.1 UDP-glucose 4-epimerase [BD1-7 clade bacterium]
MKKRILVTGSEGLIGKALCPALVDFGFDILPFDIKSGLDICNESSLTKPISKCDGIIHLAAVSRVVWAENDPELCWKTNAIASQMLIDLATKQERSPWVLVASSREVYGQPTSLPTPDDAPRKPINIYGESKVAMEDAALAARDKGALTAIVRLANVYGTTDDHDDRVLPAFCRAAVEGKPLRIDGGTNTFDFTHISDTVTGLLAVIEKLEAAITNLPPLHLLPGIPTTLKQAADFAIAAANSPSNIIEASPRTYDVGRFYGEPLHAKNLLNWEAKVTPEAGIRVLVEAFQRELKGVNA